MRRLGIDRLLLRVLVLAEGAHDLDLLPLFRGGLLFGPGLEEMEELAGFLHK